ncbi:hypothetical protein C8R43DRAFT_328470 [Mycena crocata]|nr:hypothetical protein C8R43DRAFT_328470 [Mycena crocata]
MGSILLATPDFTPTTNYKGLGCVTESMISVIVNSHDGMVCASGKRHVSFETAPFFCLLVHAHRSICLRFRFQRSFISYVPLSLLLVASIYSGTGAPTSVTEHGQCSISICCPSSLSASFSFFNYTGSQLAGSGCVLDPHFPILSGPFSLRPPTRRCLFCWKHLLILWTSSLCSCFLSCPSSRSSTIFVLFSIIIPKSSVYRYYSACNIRMFHD